MTQFDKIVLTQEKAMKYDKLIRKFQKLYSEMTSCKEENSLEDYIKNYALNSIFVEDLSPKNWREFTVSNKILNTWQVCEEYENYDYSSLINLFNEKVYEFRHILEFSSEKIISIVNDSLAE